MTEHEYRARLAAALTALKGQAKRVLRPAAVGVALLVGGCTESMVPIYSGPGVGMEAGAETAPTVDSQAPTDVLAPYDAAPLYADATVPADASMPADASVPADGEPSDASDSVDSGQG
jgi:hypothetical protein